jgi:hypothetical protein
MDWSKAYPAPATRFGLSRLAAVAGVDVRTVQRWQHIGALPGKRVGRGRVRTYDVWDALRLRCLAEMSRLGMRLTGPGLHLSSALTGMVLFEVAQRGSIEGVPADLRLYPDGDDWLMQWDPRVPDPEGSHIRINLRALAEGVSDADDLWKP